MPASAVSRRAIARPLGRRLFRFALVADTHVNPEDGVSSSPFRTNALANDRARHVFAEINRLEPRPEFTVHLGDIVHPVPDLASHRTAVERFKTLASQLEVPLHVLPGNHDVGDKRVEWMPAGTVTQDHVDAYRGYYGNDYRVFDTHECRFVLLNAQLINSGLKSECEQARWFEGQLAELRGRRWFLCMHYPPYVTDRREPGTYDNIDEPARSRLLAQIEAFRPEALFCGHVHHFWYDVIGRTQMYLLPATSFLRHDYTDFYHVDPGDEFGRNDVAKFGYFVVDVHEHGHVSHCVRTYGATCGGGEGTADGAVRPIRLAPVHTRTNDSAAVGIDLRHPWAELVEIAATGGVQEFERKKARNDYPLLALWEMGARRLRVPLQDFLDDRIRDRMRLLADLGHEFHAYCYGIPEGAARAALERDGALLSSLEIVLPWDRLRSQVADLRSLRLAADVPVSASKLRKHEDARFDGSQFSHFINHGFVLNEAAQIVELSRADPERCSFDAFSFRVPRHAPVVAAIDGMGRLARDIGRMAMIHVRLAAEHPAEPMNDDLASACRIAEAVVASIGNPSVMVFVDTFMDVDRGYFPRTGFIDRRFNPRLASRVYAHLHAALGPDPVVDLVQTKHGGLTIVSGTQGSSSIALLLPDGRQRLEKLDLAGLHGHGAAARAIDLDRGCAEAIEIQECVEPSTSVRLAHPMTVSAPLLLQWEADRASTEGMRHA